MRIALVRYRYVAAVLLLTLIAAGGVVVVRELTSPTPLQAVPPIDIDAQSGAQAGEAAEDETGDRRQRRRRDASRDAFSAGAGSPSAGQEGGAPDTPPPQQTAEPNQLEVAPLPPAGDDGDTDDGGDG